MRRKRRAKRWAVLGCSAAGLALAIRLSTTDLIGLGRHAGDIWTWTERISWFAGTASLVAALIALQPRMRGTSNPITGIGSQQRTVMLRRIRHKWIAGILEPSLANAARLVLGLERSTGLLDLGERAVQRAGRPATPVPEGTSISSLFDESGSSLLIAGAPGSGKTTALLELCDVLLDRADHDPEQPIPVVINLSSWALRRTSIEAWVVEELTLAYQVPRRIAAEMVRAGELALLLDGLDEVTPTHRNACVEAINEWRRDHGLVPVAVCSRKTELDSVEARLLLDEAVELLPPSDAQIDHYLERLQQSGTPVGEIRGAVRTDREMRDLLRSPLMLHVVTLAYHGRNADALRQPGTVPERRDRLWTAYISRMFEQRPLPAGSGYTERQAVEWLAALARILQAQNQTEVHLDRLTPEWLRSPTARRRAHLATISGGGLLTGAVGGATFGLIDRAYDLDFGPGAGALGGLIAGLASAALGSLLLGLSGGLAKDNPSRDRVIWSWLKLRQGSAAVLRDVRAAAFAPAFGFGLSAAGSAAVLAGSIARPAVACFAGLASGLGCGVSWCVLGLVAGEQLSVKIAPTEQLAWSWAKLRQGIWTAVYGGVVGGLVFGVGAVVASGPGIRLAGTVSAATSLTLAAIILAGLSPTLRDERALPNEGIRRSARYALLVGLPIGVLTGAIFAVSGRLAAEPPNYLLAGLGGGLPFGVASGLIFGGGACLQHYLVRAWLVSERTAPWRYADFLVEMNDRLLIRRSGSAFLFIHRLLREHLSAFPTARVDEYQGRQTTELVSGGGRESNPPSPDAGLHRF